MSPAAAHHVALGGGEEIHKSSGGYLEPCHAPSALCVLGITSGARKSDASVVDSSTACLQIDGNMVSCSCFLHFCSFPSTPRLLVTICGNMKCN